MSPPTVSVLIPAYGTSAYIAETLESVFRQTWSDFEIIVINDGDPETGKLEAALAPFRSRIVYLHKQNGGPASARNAGLAVARGRYVALLDSDDIWEPEFLSALLEPLESTACADVVFPDALIFGDSVSAGRRYYEVFPPPGEITFQRLIGRESYVFISSVIRRDRLQQAGGFDERLRGTEDYDLWLRLSKLGARFVFIDRVLVRYRSRADSLSHDVTGMPRSLIGIYTAMAARDDLTPVERQATAQALSRERASLALEEGRLAFFREDYPQARRKLIEANRYFRTRKTAIIIALLRLAPGVLRAASRLRQRWSATQL
jgi:glycosyltransferase involved in cell wall biosynthesis